MSASLVDQVAARFEAREAEGRAVDAAAAEEQAARLRLFRAAAAALAKGATPPKGAGTAAQLDSLLLALGKSPADLAAEVERFRGLLAEAEAADPPAAAADEALARSRHAVAMRRREEAAREAQRAVERAGAEVAQAEGIARARRATVSRLLDDVPSSAFAAYDQAQRVLDVATTRLSARLMPERFVPLEAAQVSVASLEDEVKRAAAAASAEWRKLVARVGESE